MTITFTVKKSLKIKNLVVNNFRDTKMLLKEAFSFIISQIKLAFYCK